jgi:flagellar hook-basal body complex protein FliE
MMDLMKLVPPMPDKVLETPVATPKMGAGAHVAQEFGNILKEKMGDLVEVTQESARADRDFAAGKTDNIHEVMISAAKASLAVDTAVQIRNLAIRAYQSLTQLR